MRDGSLLPKLLALERATLSGRHRGDCVAVSTRKRFVLSSADIDYLKRAAVGGHPSGTQARANAAWAVLGLKLGFEWTSVEPTGEGERYFSAEVRRVCTAEGEVRCPRRVVININGEDWCEEHYRWLIEDGHVAQEASA